MVFLEPKKWLSWLPLAEWWYNTNYHTSLKSIPFEALYGYPPPMISKVMIPGHPSSSIDFLAPKQEMLLKLKANLAQAQGRIKKYADLNRTERSFNPSDMVYLRLQPFRHNAFGIHQNLKHTTKCYSPFLILEKIGLAAYKLQLLDTADIHPVFHVSQLKNHIGAKAVPQANLPLVTPEGYIKIDPVTMLETRALPRRGEVVTQWKIQWANLTPDQATWEDKLSIKATFPSFYHKTLQEWWPPTPSCGQEVSQGEGSCEDTTVMPTEDTRNKAPT
jgi:hypothetical protein